LNLPKDTPKEVVANIYINAWKEGLKGVTVYRDGCRSGVLINSDQINPERHSPKRPKELLCDVYYTKVSKKLDKLRFFEYIVFIGLIDGKPYELFAIEGSNGKKLTTGKIIKHKRGCYDVILDDGHEYKNITDNTTPEEDVLTRMISTSLRHGVPIHYIVEQLQKIEGDMFGFAKCISRALKKFIKDGTKTSEECPECGAKLIFEGGCYGCKQCGYQKCS
jgi:ribonucleoside-diphosphate reductase alpha chain